GADSRGVKCSEGKGELRCVRVDVVNFTGLACGLGNPCRNPTTVDGSITYNLFAGGISSLKNFPPLARCGLRESQHGSAKLERTHLRLPANQRVDRPAHYHPIAA